MNYNPRLSAYNKFLNSSWTEKIRLALIIIRQIEKEKYLENKLANY